MAKHKYGSEGSDRKHGAPRMLAKCTCGWQGPVLEGQGMKEREESVKQWGYHLGWMIHRQTDNSWMYRKDNFVGTAPNHWAACRAVEEKENDR